MTKRGTFKLLSAASALIVLAALSLAIVGCEKGPAKSGTAGQVFANTHCPIMGTPIKPENVTPALMHDFNGKKVAFCCSMCPPQWEKLTDVEKEAKLAKAK